MDAAKAQYIHFLPQVKRLLDRGGILISDNVLQDGDILESHYAVERRNRTIYKRMREYLHTLKHDPELVTSIVAARKGETGMAVGNVVGSNIFNVLLILGVSSAIHPIAVNAASVWDLYILIGIGILTYVFGLTKKSIKRPEGAVMVLLYFAAMAFAIVR
jgi:cation:H+ antiporter